MHSDNQMHRTIAIPGLASRTAYGRFAANQLYGAIQASYRFTNDDGASYVAPFFQLLGSTSMQDAFSESGADSLNLSVASQRTDSLRSVLGLQFGHDFDVGLEDKLNVQAKVGWAQELGSTSRPVTAAFAGAPGLPFTVYGNEAQRSALNLGLGASLGIGSGMSLFLRYDGNVANDEANHTLSVGFRFVW
jgi:outer membrane autotransporter protein